MADSAGALSFCFSIHAKRFPLTAWPNIQHLNATLGALPESTLCPEKRAFCKEKIMKETTISACGRGVALAALAAFGMLSTAHADWTNHYDEGGISAPGYFSNFGPAGNGATPDYSQYEAINLGPLSASLMAPKSGARGPVRDEDAMRLETQTRDIEARLGFIGGRNTP